MTTLNPGTMGIKALSNFLTSAIVPRPIAFVSTVDENGNANLSPFSFFNVFSSQPPVLIFSPAKSALTGKQKDTYHNIKKTPECVIHIANYSMVEQLSVTSGSYPPGVNEFVKGGFTEEKSIMVRPPRIKEAPVAFECKVNQVIELGESGGSGNLVICEVLLIHHHSSLADENGNIIFEKLDPVARLGYNNYVRFKADNVFETPKPLKTYGIGVDAIPDWIKNAHRLTGNELGKLASISTLPDKEIILTKPGLREMVANFSFSDISQLLSENKIEEAWLVLLHV